MCKVASYKAKQSENCSVLSDSFWAHGLYSPWNSPGQNTGEGSLSFLQGIFPTQGSNPGLLHCRQILYQLSHEGSLRILEWVAYLFSSRSSWPKHWTRVSCITTRFLTTELSGSQLKNASRYKCSVLSCSVVWTITRQGPLSLRILQARILQWVAMPSCKESSQPRDRAQVCSFAGGFFTIWAAREAQIETVINISDY